MLTSGSRVFGLAAAVSLAGTIGYALASADQSENLVLRSGTVLLLASIFAFVVLALAVLVGTGPSDKFVYPGQEDLRPSRSANSTVVPLVASIGAGAIVLGMALGSVYIVAGFAVIAAACLIWFSQAWRDHPDYFSGLTKRVQTYVGLPFGMPIALLCLIAFGAISVSRTLLSVSHTAAWIIAIGICIAVFIGGLIIASRPSVSRRTTIALLAVVAVLVTALGVIGLVRGQYHGGETEKVEKTTNAKAGA